MKVTAEQQKEIEALPGWDTFGDVLVKTFGRNHKAAQACADVLMKLVQFLKENENSEAKLHKLKTIKLL